MKRQAVIWGIMLCAFLAGCGGAEEALPEQPSLDESILDPVIERKIPEPLEGEDLILSSVNAAVDGGRTLRLDAVGKMEPDSQTRCGIREVLIYEDGKLRQTVSVSESAAAPSAALGEGYTESPSVEDAMAVGDMNFDGAEDIALYGGSAGGSVSRHYWLWNQESGRYAYAFTLSGAEAVERTDPETGESVREIICDYRRDENTDCTDAYRYAAPYGPLILARRVVRDWKHGTEDFPLVEYYAYPDGQEVFLRQEFTDYDDAGRTIREIREMVDGQLRAVRLEQLEMADGEMRVVRTAHLQIPEPELPPENELPEGTELPPEEDAVAEDGELPPEEDYPPEEPAVPEPVFVWDDEAA